MAWDAFRRRKDAPPWRPKTGGSFSRFISQLGKADGHFGEKEPAANLLPHISEEDLAPSQQAHDRPLTVCVNIRLMDPAINSTYRRDYVSSHTLKPTERLCRGLLRRIEHCSEELITRKDCGALQSQRHADERHAPGLIRYTMSFQIVRQGAQLWAERTFASYQKQGLTVDDAREILHSSHRMVGLFLRRHDADFRWTDDPVRDESSDRALTTKPSVGVPLSLACVPRSHFIESSQSFEFIPGYAIELSFTSRSRARRQFEWKRLLRLDSSQASPLNLACAEDLLWRTSKAVGDAIGVKREEFLDEHRRCEWLEGMVSCQHFEEDALHVELRITNNLGPGYDNLHRTVRSRLGLFRHRDGDDCHHFLRRLQHQLAAARDVADTTMSSMSDFDFRILELRGQGWKADKPAQFSLQTSDPHSRRSIEAILARVQSGIADVLHGNDIAIHVGAYKRGHLILDKALIAHAQPAVMREKFGGPDEEKEAFISRLKTRIQQDLDRICADTCSINDLLEEEEKDLPEEAPKPEEIQPQAPEQLPHSAVELPAEAPADDPFPMSTPLIPRVFPSVPARHSRCASTDSGHPCDEQVPELMTRTDGDNRDGLDQEIRLEPLELSNEEKAGEELHSQVATGELDASTSSALRAAYSFGHTEANTDKETHSNQGEDERAYDGSRDGTRTPTTAEDEDGDSSRASTPALSFGADFSPEDSLLVTPTAPRTNSVAQIAVKTEPEASHNTDGQPMAASDEDVVDGAGSMTPAREGNDTVELSNDFFEEGFSRTKPDLEFDEDTGASEGEIQSDLDGEPAARDSEATNNLDLRDGRDLGLTGPEVDVGPETCDMSETDSLPAGHALDLGLEIPAETEADVDYISGEDHELTSEARPKPQEQAVIGVTSPDDADALGRDDHTFGRDDLSDHQENTDDAKDTENESPHSEIGTDEQSPRLLSGSTIVVADGIRGSRPSGCPEPAQLSETDSSPTTDVERLAPTPPTASATIPALSLPTRNKTSSEDWEDCNSACGDKPEDVRGSVETVDDLAEDWVEDDEPSPARPVLAHRFSAPPRPNFAHRLSAPTAGYLGLHETRLLDMGLRGALVGPGRFGMARPLSFSLHLQDAEEEDEEPNSAAVAVADDDEPLAGHGEGEEAKGLQPPFPGVMSSSSSPTPSLQLHRPRLHRRAKSSSSKAALMVPRQPPPKKKTAAEPQSSDSDSALPRVMFMFAGMAVASQMLNKSS